MSRVIKEAALCFLCQITVYASTSYMHDAGGPRAVHLHAHSVYQIDSDRADEICLPEVFPEYIRIARVTQSECSQRMVDREMRCAAMRAHEF